MFYLDVAMLLLFTITLASSVLLLCTEWAVGSKHRNEVLLDVSAYVCVVCMVYLATRFMTQGAVL